MTPGHIERAEKLRRLLEKWTQVDEQIEAGISDVWERQALRRQARSLLAGDPELLSEFEDELASHPELTKP